MAERMRKICQHQKKESAQATQKEFRFLKFGHLHTINIVYAVQDLRESTRTVSLKFLQEQEARSPTPLKGLLCCQTCTNQSKACSELACSHQRRFLAPVGRVWICGLRSSTVGEGKATLLPLLNNTGLH